MLIILEPVQLAVLELSKQTTNLLMAEATDVSFQRIKNAGKILKISLCDFYFEKIKK
jgi:hypothetical protein